MSNPETPEEKMSVADARISWAASFLVDWIIPLIEDKRIHTPDQIIQLRSEFMLPSLENTKGIDFTINDALKAAVQWQEYQQKLHPHIPIEKLPSGKAWLKAIDLLTAAVHPPPQSEHWTQMSFLDE